MYYNKKKDIVKSMNIRKKKIKLSFLQLIWRSKWKTHETKRKIIKTNVFSVQ